MTVQPPTERGATIWVSAPGRGDVGAAVEALAARLRTLGRRAEALDGRAVRVGLVGRLLARNGVLAVAPADTVEADAPCARHELRVTVTELPLEAWVERVVATLRARELLPATSERCDRRTDDDQHRERVSPEVQ